ncbi:SDR family oxidoreductase [soil metagenome]
MTRPVALVTGGAKRIGAALALSCAQAGYDVIVHHRSSPDEAEATAEELRATGVRAALVQGDLALEADRATVVPRALEAFGRLDLLINNASLFEYDDLAGLTEGSLQQHMAVNVFAPLMLTKAFAAALPDDREGVVVNMLDHKVEHPNPDFFAYTTSRVAIAGMTGALALALAPRIRLNGIAPGLTLPSMGWKNADFDAGAAALPLKRSTPVSDLCAALRFILEARSLTGQILTVDSGASLSPRLRDLEFEGEAKP